MLRFEEASKVKIEGWKEKYNNMLIMKHASFNIWYRTFSFHELMSAYDKFVTFDEKRRQPVVNEDAMDEFILESCILHPEGLYTMIKSEPDKYPAAVVSIILEDIYKYSGTDLYDYYDIDTYIDLLYSVNVPPSIKANIFRNEVITKLKSQENKDYLQKYYKISDDSKFYDLIIDTDGLEREEIRKKLNNIFQKLGYVEDDTPQMDPFKNSLSKEQLIQLKVDYPTSNIYVMPYSAASTEFIFRGMSYAELMQLNEKFDTNKLKDQDSSSYDLLGKDTFETQRDVVGECIIYPSNMKERLKEPYGELAFLPNVLFEGILIASGWTAEPPKIY